MWNELIGQEFSVKTLQQASLDSKLALTGKVVSGFSQAWLITGPPGSGRSTAARLFAATLQCEENGCGKCVSCISVKNGTHPDVHVITPTGLSYGISDTKDLVREAAMLPSLGQWKMLID
jgi:DNA polymerase-3 subunit delta'